MKVITKILFCFLVIFTLFGCMQNLETNEVDHDDEQKQTIYNLAVESGYNGTYEEWVASIRGASIVLQVSNGYIQWASTDKSLWHNLVSLEELAGEDGKDGKETEFRVDSGYIQWRYTTDSTWTNLISLADITGQDGKNIELKVNNDVIQWRQEGSNNWQDLISLSSLSGEDGLTPEFKTTQTHLVWKYTIEADSEWRRLLDLSTLKGEAGEDGLNGKDGRTPEFRVHEGYMQWKYTDEDDTKWVNIMPYYVPEKEMVTVTYDYGNGTKKVVEYEKGSTINIPENIVEETRQTTGDWYYNNRLWDFDFYVASKDITLTTRWIDAPLFVFVNSVTNEIIDEQYVYYGKEVTMPSIPEMDGYKFEFWHSLRNAWNEETESFTNVYSYTGTYYIYTQYEEKNNIIFRVNGEVCHETSAYVGDTIILPDNPSDGDDYRFDYWNMSGTYIDLKTETFVLSSEYKNNGTIYIDAVFEHKINIVFVSEDEIYYQTKKYAGEVVEFPDNPLETEEITFVGWELSGKVYYKNEETNFIVPQNSHNDIIYLYAKWNYGVTLVYDNVSQGFDINKNWHNSTKDVFNITNNQAPWEITWNKAQGQEWSALQVKVKGNLGNFERINIGLELSNGVKAIVNVRTDTRILVENEFVGTGNVQSVVLDISDVTIEERDSISLISIFVNYDVTEQNTGELKIHWAGFDMYMNRFALPYVYNGTDNSFNINAENRWVGSKEGAFAVTSSNNNNQSPWVITYTNKGAWDYTFVKFEGLTEELNKVSIGIEAPKGMKMIVKIEGSKGAKEVIIEGTGECAAFTLDFSDLTAEQKQNLNTLFIFIDYQNGKAHSGSITVHWVGIIK